MTYTVVIRAGNKSKLLEIKNKDGNMETIKESINNIVNTYPFKTFNKENITSITLFDANGESIDQSNL